MNKVLRILSTIAAFGAATLVAQAQPAPKIFVVDMAKLLESHYKTEEQMAKLRADEQKAQVELERLNKEGNALVEQYKEFVEKANNNPLASNDAKAKAEQEAQAKLEEIEKKKQEIQVFKNNVERQLAQRLRSFREIILEEISKAATDIAKSKGATVVVDKSGPSGIGISNFIYLDPSYEITDDVLKEVNKGRPATPAPAATAPATTTGSTPAPKSAPSGGEAPTVTFPGAKKN
ncbi:MAG TPA: OmpH family outer membrane protein [Opitutaceae bacterium]|jgi:outer membrane protein|nr:OmpH family outer membrane protein [Opitutaceae bacterium]HRE05109.1 OmpH family outer membrane protein [Opitutaceae bacterium]